MFGMFPAIEFDGAGNLLFRASRHDPDPIDIGGGPIAHAGMMDIVVGRFDRDGAHLVSVGYGGTAPEFVNGGAVSLADGSFIISGLLGIGTSNVGGDDFTKNASGNLFDSYIARYDTNGNHVWSVPLEAGSSSVLITGIAADGTGGVVATGSFDGAFTVAGQNSGAPAGARDIFLVRMDADGNVVGSLVTFGSVADETPNQLVAAGPGELYMCGTFSGALSLGSQDLDPVGTTDMFVASITPGGSVTWATSAGGDSTTNCRTVAVTGSGNVLAAGDFFDTTSVSGGDTLTSEGAEDIWIAQLRASDGSHVRSYSFGGALADRPRTVAAAPDGTIALTGEFSDVIDFGGGNLVSAGSIDLFVTRLALDGQHIWSMRAGDTDEDRGLGLLVDDTGSLYMTGSFHESIDFGGESVLTGPSTAFNGFIVKIF